MPIAPEHLDLLHAHLLKRTPVSAEDLEVVDRAFTTMVVPRNTFLVRAGEISQHEHYVISGCLRTFMLDTEGNEHTIYFPIEDWWAGDPRSTGPGIPSHLYVETLEPCTLLSLDRAGFAAMYERPQLERYFRILWTNAYHALQDRMYESLALTGRERLLLARRRFPWMEQRLAQKHIASYLGITPEALSRIRAKLLTEEGRS